MLVSVSTVIFAFSPSVAILVSVVIAVTVSAVL
jgi:hypothetical protein